MRIRLERTGGVAGLRRSFAVDSATLAPEQETELRALLAAADLDHAPSTPALRPGQVDAFLYRLTVEDEGVERCMSVGEEALTSELSRLLDWLQERSA